MFLLWWMYRNYDKFHLPSNVTASSFGKLVMKQNAAEGVKEEDIARALLLMVTSNIGQVRRRGNRIATELEVVVVGGGGG